MRQPRKIVPDARYHVVARANRGEFILHSHAMKCLLEETLVRAKAKYAFRLDNHLHLIIHPIGATSLSRVMQWVLSVFAMKFNRIYNLRGHVWYDRFKSRVIDNIRQYLATFAYVNQNPVKAGLAQRPSEYPYCGLHHIRNGSFLVVDPPDVLVRLLEPAFAPLLLT